jgi:deoxycytidylate deaminase
MSQEQAVTSMDSELLAYPKDPELVIGIVAPIGTPLPYFKRRLARVLEQWKFTVHNVKLSEIAAKTLDLSAPAEELPYARYCRLMSAGNSLRSRSGRDDILAMFAAAEINELRPDSEPKHFSGAVFVVDQLKRPEEVFRFRRIYGEHFLLIGLYCPKHIRKKHLEHKGMEPQEAESLVQRDEDDATESGQRVADTFHLADIFIDVTGNVGDRQEEARIDQELIRFWDLVLGAHIVTPSRDEHGMHLAHAASLRSSSLARQVGAAIVSQHSELISVGANDIPCHPGGLYWGDERDHSGESRDARDHKLGYDESDRMKREIIREILPVLVSEWNFLSPEAREDETTKALKQLKGTRLASLTEFARAVHAEMEALLSAARIGVSVRGATLFTTTFPCHNCAKHIVAAGIERVVYVEPYPKSRALQMYSDSIYALGESEVEGRASKVLFEPFVGVSPRRFTDLFGRYSHEGRQWEYKDKSTGYVTDDELRLRIPFSPFSYVIREGLAAKDLSALKEKIHAAPKTGSPAGSDEQPSLAGS